jgi:dTDP-4-amino-4,6-dideoxygalactose transaminase
MIILSRPSIGPEEISAVVEVLESGMLASGARVREFEEKFAAACGTPRQSPWAAALQLSISALWRWESAPATR